MLTILKSKYTLVIALLLLVWWWRCVPFPLFDSPTSMILTDQQGDLLSARIAKDGQWRFPRKDTVPDKFATAIVAFEDRRFYKHWGIDPIGIFRAIKQNVKERRIVSGGSTLTMQTARLARKNQARNFKEKIIEMIWALRIELGYSKSEILSLYIANAPFGGNVVGLEAACWRYYGKKSNLLSWGEAATLAVLPNSPALIHPGRNRSALREKRNRLLDRLLAAEKIDTLTCDLAKSEQLPDEPLRLPNAAPHLLDRAFSEKIRGKKTTKTLVYSTINGNLQRSVNRIANKHNQYLKANEIHNLAILVLDVEKNEVLAYIGNAETAGRAHQESVDVIKAGRSTGSILKPFLYANALQDGNIMPRSILKDTPVNYNGYRPENFDKKYDGRVGAHRALIRSLNVPMVNLLESYGLEKFHNDLRKIGLTTLNQSAEHYGLTLILGGAEGSLWDISNAYAGMARTLKHFSVQSGEYRKDDFDKATYSISKKEKNEDLVADAEVLSAASIYATFEAMKEVERPNASGAWQRFGSGRQVAWKTGTSFGFRDAWAVGVTPDYVVGVWAGNADGVGRPGCIGISAAAPILFDVFSILPRSNNWFQPPFDEMTSIAVCQKSGERASFLCEVDTLFVPNSCLKNKACTFHKKVFLDANEAKQVNSDCYAPTMMRAKPWFALKPVEEYYYKKKHPDYKPLPPYANGCVPNEDRSILQFIYPRRNTQVHVPIDVNGERSRVILKAAHRQATKRVHWHLDDQYLGETQELHTMEVMPQTGKHHLTLIDEDGVRIETFFEVVD